jgi:hypothetical protein
MAWKVQHDCHHDGAQRHGLWNPCQRTGRENNGSRLLPKFQWVCFSRAFRKRDANPDIGDSAITETAGIGGFAMATAPAIVTFVGGTPKDAMNATLEMYEITFAESKYFTMPALDFRGTPTGIDIRKVVELGITPRINTGLHIKMRVWVRWGQGW